MDGLGREIVGGWVNYRCQKTHAAKMIVDRNSHSGPSVHGPTCSIVTLHGMAGQGWQKEG